MSGHLVVIAFLWAVVAVGVGAHASSVDRSGIAWGLVTFVLGIFGVVAYMGVLLASDDGGDDASGSFRVCPACSTSHAGSPEYCSDCGEPLGSDDQRTSASVLRSGSRGYCSNCKAPVALDADACSSCDAVF